MNVGSKPSLQRENDGLNGFDDRNRKTTNTFIHWILRDSFDDKDCHFNAFSISLSFTNAQSVFECRKMF